MNWGCLRDRQYLRLRPPRKRSSRRLGLIWGDDVETDRAVGLNHGSAYEEVLVVLRTYMYIYVRSTGAVKPLPLLFPVPCPPCDQIGLQGILQGF